MKTCRGCGAEKNLSEFYRHASMADGPLNYCIECVCARVRKHRRLNDSVREYDRERAKLPTRIAYARENTVQWRAENPEKYAAHTALNNAVRDGKVTKEPCYFCGSEEDLHGHHKDYARPLDVIWVCAKCHHRLHALEGAA